MYKRILLIALSVFMVLGLMACTAAPAAPGGESKIHIGVVTGTVSQGEDELRGAEAMIEKYGDADKGGMIKHVTYPDNFMQEQETTIAQIIGLSDDPDMKAIVVNQAVPGTSAAFKEIRAKRPDIILLANSSQEDTAMIEAAADLVIDPDNINRGYLMVLAAKKMGAKTFVHISFPRHMSIELLSVRRNIMEEAAKDLGLKFLKRVAELGAIFVEPDLPSPIMGYPGAFGIDLKDQAGDWPAILKKVEEAVVAAGGSGRMGTWAFSYGYTATQALVEYGKQVAEGTMQKDNLVDVLKAFEMYTPGAAWNGSLLYDRVANEEIKNHVMVYQDTYVFGTGYIGNGTEVVPDKYKDIK